MSETLRIAILAGDGIGPEITESALEVLSAVEKTWDINFDISHAPIGGAAFKLFDDPYPAETEAVCRNADAVLLGAVGSPEFDRLPSDKRPEKGLLRLRESLGGFANLRPVKAIDSLLDASPLKTGRISGTDLLIVRELLGGIYFGKPRERDAEKGLDTMIYHKHEVERVARIAFETARSRKGRVTSVDKANVLDSSVLWRETVNELAKEYPDVEIEHEYVDACAMHLITNPRRFDVIVTGNMFGDILSDAASVLTGSIGVLHSATIGGEIDLYEPIHGSAPDIAGLGIANPIGMINSVGAMFRHTFGREDIADSIETSVETVLTEGIRTEDISEDGKSVSTVEMTARIVDRIPETAEIKHSYHAV